MFHESREPACNTPLTPQPKTGFFNDRLSSLPVATEEGCACSQLLFDQSWTVFHKHFFHKVNAIFKGN